jgi:hypothetical protein
MSNRNTPKTGVGATTAQVQSKLVRAGQKPAGVKTVKDAQAAAARVTRSANKKALPVPVPNPNATPSFIGKAARARVGGIFGTRHV